MLFNNNFEIDKTLTIIPDFNVFLERSIQYGSVLHYLKDFQIFKTSF